MTNRHDLQHRAAAVPGTATGAAPRGGAIAAVVLGVVVAVSGFLTALSGAALLALFGGGHAVASGDHIVSTPTSAIVADLGHIDNIRGFEPLTGSPTCRCHRAATSTTAACSSASGTPRMSSAT